MPRRSSVVAFGTMSVIAFGLAGGVASLAQQTSPAQPSDVVAKVGDRVITVEGITAKLRALPESVRERLTKDKNLRIYVQAMIVKDLFAREAERLGLDKDPAVKAQLEESRRNVLYGALRTRLLTEVTVSDAEMTAYYEAHRSEYAGKSYLEVKPLIAERLRETKTRQVAERTEREAAARWPVTLNETALKSISVPKGQWTEDIEKAIQDTERRMGPLSEETKQKLREATPTVVTPTLRR